jgi:transposase
MKKLDLSKDQLDALNAHEATIKSRRAYKRWQSVWLTYVKGYSKEKAADLIGIHLRTVEKHQKRYRDQGIHAFSERTYSPTGSRFVSQEEEARFFQEKLSIAQAGQIIRARDLHADYMELIGTSCCLGTLYQALKRHSWSKTSPRPRHPKGDEEAKETFKKNG